MTARRALLVPLGLVGAIVALLAAGRGDLAAPPPDVGGLGAWVEERGTVAAALALVRLGGLLVATWWAVAACVALGARSLGAVRLAGVAQRVLPVPLRRAVAGVALSLSAAACGDQSAAVPEGEPIVLLPAEAPPGGTAVMSVVDDEPVAPAPAPAPVPPPADDEWVVAPGESFWSIAEDVVAEAVGRPPTDREVTAYWRVLIDANRGRLVAGDPDIVHPGQRFTVPPVP